MQSPDTASSRCIPIALTLCLLLAMPIFLMMFVDVNAAPLPQQVATVHAPHHAAAAQHTVTPPGSHP